MLVSKRRILIGIITIWALMTLVMDMAVGARMSWVAMMMMMVMMMTMMATMVVMMNVMMMEISSVRSRIQGVGTWESPVALRYCHTINTDDFINIVIDLIFSFFVDMIIILTTITVIKAPCVFIAIITTILSCHHHQEDDDNFHRRPPGGWWMGGTRTNLVMHWLWLSTLQCTLHNPHSTLHTAFASYIVSNELMWMKMMMIYTLRCIFNCPNQLACK